MAVDKGVGIVLNFTAAMIVVDFDDIVVKIFVTLKTKALFKDFLNFKTNLGQAKSTENCGLRCKNGPLMKWMAFLMSFGALTFAVAHDFNLINVTQLIPAVVKGFNLQHSKLITSNIDDLRFHDYSVDEKFEFESYESMLLEEEFFV